VDCFVGIVRLRLIPTPRCRVDMTVGWQDADMAHEHHHGEKQNTHPGHYKVVSRQPHWEELYTVPYLRQAKSLLPKTGECLAAFSTGPDRALGRSGCPGAPLDLALDLFSLWQPDLSSWRWRARFPARRTPRARRRAFLPHDLSRGPTRCSTFVSTACPRDRFRGTG